MTQLVATNLHTHLKAVADAVLASADPGEALVQHWPTDPAAVGSLQKGILVAAGKASIAMTRAALERLNVTPNVAVVLAPAGTKPPTSFHAPAGRASGTGGEGAGGGVKMYEVDHPLPTQRNLIAARAVGDAARLASSRRLPLLVLLSGGASAHLTVPDRGLTLSDIRNITDLLLKSGATISELNLVRSCCETLKAGGLARLAAPSPVHTFILSDVLGDPIDVIASAPTADGLSSVPDALRVLEERKLTSAVPGITAHLKARASDRSLRPPAAVTNATNVIIGSNASAVVAARDTLTARGFTVAEARLSVEGEAAQRGDELASRLLALQAKNPGRHLALIWGGETTVSARASKGFGGRNQEAALAAAIRIAGKPNVAVMCLATDGVDGLTPPGTQPHAGAIVTGDSTTAAKRAGADPAHCLATHDSYSFAEALGVTGGTGGSGGAIKIGPTGTNVNDIWVGLAF